MLDRGRRDLRVLDGKRAAFCFHPGDQLTPDVRRLGVERKHLVRVALLDLDQPRFQGPSLRPFGEHKGYGMALINELYGAYTGGSLPTLRGPTDKCPAGEKPTTCFYFPAIKPEAMGVSFAAGRDQAANVKAVIDDILGHGNTPPEGRAMLPGKIEADNAALSAKHGGLLFTPAEMTEFAHIAEEAGVEFDAASFPTVEI